MMFRSVQHSTIPHLVGLSMIASMTWCLSAVSAGAPSSVHVQPAVKSVDDVRSMLSAALPADALELVDAAASAKAGQTITVRGYISDAADAMSPATAEFVLTPAPKLSDAAASTPRATVRIRDPKGDVLKGALNGQLGLRAGAEVFVTGKVESTNSKDAITLSATALHVPRSPLPADVFSAKPIAGARDVSEARKAGGIKVGDEVVLRGRVGGSKDPFVSGRAVLTLVGRGLKACNENPDDHCSKPWDYCCETRDVILANSITVQLVDAKSQVLRTDLKGRHGIKELSEIVVAGKVASADGKGVVINATAISLAK